MSATASPGSTANPRPLVVGYGNPLRTDDGIGGVVAGRLLADPRFAGIDVLQRHQLTPELALDFSEADAVVLVDARSGPPAGSIAVETVDADSPGETAWSHHVGPATLVALARELYGRAPVVHVVSVGAGSLEVGQGLTPAVAAAVDDAIEQVARIIRHA